MSQLLLIVGAVTILGMLFIPASKLSVNRDQILLGTEATSTGTALAQEVMEQIILRKFDENKCGQGDTIKNLTDLTASASLGLDATSKGDTSGKLSTYDDIDDFNNYVGTISTPRLGDFV